MGAVAQAVGDFASQAVETVFEPIKQVGQVAESVVREVGHAAESVGREVGKVGQAAVNDPVGTIAKVAAIATQQYWALPLISAATVMAHGGDLGQAALAAGISYAAAGIAEGVGDYLGAAGSGTVEMMSQDAVELANQGLTGSQISEILQQSYGVSGDIAGQTAAQAAIGQTAAEIAKDIGGQMATQNLLANAAGNMVGGASRTALSGGDLNQILMGGVTSGAGSLAGGYASNELKDLGVNNTVANVLGKSAGAATASTIAGRDAKLSFINAMINTTLAESGKQVSSELKSAWNSVNESASKFNDGLAKSQETYNTKITPLEQEAKTTQEVAAKSFDEYKSIKDKFDGIVADYNAAKDAGDTEKANSLADQANAILPQLNDATTKYNGDVATFDSKLATYNTAVEDYKAEAARLEESKKEYEARNANLQETTKAFTETALKVADMGDNSKAAFEKLYNNGTALTDSFDAAKTLNTLQTPAQDTFLRQYDKTNDLTASLEFAQQVNSLDKNSISAYDEAVKTGLDDESALKIAPDMSGLNSTGRSVYLESLKRGDSQQTATISAILANLYADEAPTSTESPYAPVASNPTVPTSDVGGPSTPLVPNGKVTVTAPDQEFDENAPALPIPPEEEEPTLTADTDPGYQEYLNNIRGGTNPDGSMRPALAVVTTPYDEWKQNAAEDKGVPHEGKVWSETKGEWVSPGPDSGAMPGPGTYIPPIDPNVDNRDVGNGENPDPNYVAPQVPGETIGTTPSTGGGKVNVPGTTKPPTVTTPTKQPTTQQPVTPWTLPPVTTPTINMPTIGGGTPSASNLLQQDASGGIKNLTPGLTQRMDYNLTGIPNIDETVSQIPHFSTGSSVGYDPFAAGSAGDSVNAGLYKSLSPTLTKAQINYILTGLPGANIQAHSEGGNIGPEGHNPTFFSEGGLNSMENRYVEGEGDGTSDSVAAMLANGEFVIPADVVSKLGNGSNEAGAGVLDQFLKVVRKDANSNGEELPPKSKGPLAYLLDAKRTMKA
jgi:hypothetical protein